MTHITNTCPVPPARHAEVAPGCGTSSFPNAIPAAGSGRPRVREQRKAAWIVGIVALAAGWLVHAAEQEPGEGWRPLFDGLSFQGWRPFLGSGAPQKGWRIEEGILKKIARERGGNLVTEDAFEEFEFSWEWRLPASANSGVKYFVLDERRQAPGHEYQMIDDSRVGNELQKTGSFYDVLPPKPGRQPPRIGDWNESRIVVRGQKVEHWLNGERILEYHLGSPEVLEAVARSKFKDVTGFGRRVKGRIMLTDHGDEAWFRNLRIRVPDQPAEPSSKR